VQKTTAAGEPPKTVGASKITSLFDDDEMDEDGGDLFGTTSSLKTSQKPAPSKTQVS
jgi:hypothetical protein